MRSHSYINSAKNILEQYKGEMPFAAWLKTYFSAHRKYGSKDRKQISHLCYSFYRLGHAFNNLDVEERLLVSAFLASDTESFILKELRPEWNEQIQLSPSEKLKDLGAIHELANIFPWQEHLSTAIDKNHFATSFLIQPFVFLRIRPGKKQKILQQLSKAQIPYQIKDEACVAVENGTKLDEVIIIDQDVVIQDFSSQQVLTDLQKHINTTQSFAAWDCCAASGGKSILLKDTYPNVRLTATDVRESILHNLRSRFKQAGIMNYSSYIADVSASDFRTNTTFDVVLCDAPCSGSGTWSRTPEQLYFFSQDKIKHYTDLQKRIALNASRSLKPQGYFIYITCSVFREENEEVVEYLQKEASLQLLDATYHSGYQQKADTLFSAVFQLL